MHREFAQGIYLKLDNAGKQNKNHYYLLGFCELQVEKNIFWKDIHIFI